MSSRIACSLRRVARLSAALLALPPPLARVTKRAVTCASFALASVNPISAARRDTSVPLTGIRILAKGARGRSPRFFAGVDYGRRPLKPFGDQRNVLADPATGIAGLGD